MAAERRRGSDRGRPAIDWEQAFQFYASLPPDQRAYQAVADRYRVSIRTVEKHGLRDRWRERVRAIEREAAAQAAQELTQQRVQTVRDFLMLSEASRISYAQKLRQGDVRMSAADLLRLHKLTHELWHDLDALIAEPPPAQTPTAGEHSPQRKLEVLRALREAGVLPRVDELFDEHDQGEDDDGQHDRRDHERDVPRDGQADAPRDEQHHQQARQ